MYCNLDFLFLLAINIHGFLAAYSPTITIPQGQLRGTIRSDRKGGRFFAYRSIPYARPPIGALRFLPPQEHPGWDGVLNATEDLPLCFQGIGTEYCLYLSVFTSSVRNLETKNVKLKPVLVFFHGGAFIFMGAQEDVYNASYLLTQDIVLVTASFRLGLLGFFNIEDKKRHVIANAGMKDQVMILQWIRKNIKYFGGDENSVTICGESSGAVSAHLHMFSPLSKGNEGLFHRVILQSGSALNFWGIGRPGSGKQLVQKLNISSTSVMDTLQQLQNVSVNTIYNVQTTMEVLGDNRKPSFFFPIVEGNIPDAFLPEDPRELVTSGKYNHVPMIIGYNNREGIFIDVYNKLFNAFPFVYDLKYAIPSDLHVTDKETINEIIEEIEAFYFSGQQPTPDKHVQELITFLTDIIFVYGAIRTVRSHLRQGDQIYFYEFSASTKLNFLKRSTPITAQYDGASHMDELGYLFDNIYTPPVEDNIIEDRLIEKMVNLWTNFTYFGEPTFLDTSSIQWKPVTIYNYNNISNINYFRITNDSFSNGLNPMHKSVMFWDSIYQKYRK